MRKFILIMVMVAATVAIFVAASSEPKHLKVELSLQDWESVLQVIEQSNAPYPQVKQVQQALIQQLQPQVLQDSTKKE